MQVKPPFDQVNPTTRKRWMWIFIILALLMSYIMTNIGTPLKTDAAPGGILSYEFAGSVANAQAMINSWDAQAKIHAGLSLGLDFLYPFIYAMAISLAVVMASGRFNGWLQNLGSLLAWGVWVAAILDYVENVGLIMLLLGSTNELWATAAYWCAAVKFLIIILAILYALLGGLHALTKR